MHTLNSPIDEKKLNLYSSEFISIPNRSILFEWLKDVNDDLKLSSRTLFYAYYLIDLHISSIKPKKQDYQLYGSACYYISSQINDAWPEYIRKKELVELSDNSFTKNEIQRMIEKILDLEKSRSEPDDPVKLAYASFGII